MKCYKLVLASVASGLVLTAITGLVPSTPAGLVGASWYGYPLAWLTRRVLAPQYNPWYPQLGSFIADIIFWFVISAAILLLLTYLEKSKTTRKKK